MELIRNQESATKDQIVHEKTMQTTQGKLCPLCAMKNPCQLGPSVRPGWQNEHPASTVVTVSPARSQDPRLLEAEAPPAWSSSPAPCLGPGPGAYG